MTEAEAWQSLRDELDAWQHAGRIATLWWRDDDACAVTPALHRMLALSDAFSVTLGLAVVPARIAPDLAPLLAKARHCMVLQHGYSHANHAPATEKKAEFGAHRPLSDMIADAGAGWALIAGLPRAAPVFVPPWNRWTPALTPALAAIGLKTVSTYGPRQSKALASSLASVNTHIDVIDWRGTRGFLGTVSTINLLTGHLAARRLGTVDADEPTGLLTHHLDHDDKCWTFLEQLFAAIAGHCAARWLSPEVFEASFEAILDGSLAGGLARE